MNHSETTEPRAVTDPECPVDFEALHRAVWAAIEGRTFTFDRLEMLTGIRAGLLHTYVRQLAQSGYVVITGIKRANSGEALPIFRQAIRKGSQPPYWDGNTKRLIDPNVSVPTGIVKQREFPAMSARIAVAAERLLEFTRPQVIEQLFGGEPTEHELKRFMHAWTSPRSQGRIRLNVASWKCEADAGLDEIREFLRQNTGKWLSGSEVWRSLGITAAAGSRIRAAVNLLAAEGYRVRIEGRRGSGIRYLINPAEEG